MAQENTLIGQILVELGTITEQQLEESLGIQTKMSQETRKPLGQILLELDYVDPNDIVQAIRVQIERRGVEQVPSSNVN